MKKDPATQLIELERIIEKLIELWKLNRDPEDGDSYRVAVGAIRRMRDRQEERLSKYMGEDEES